MTDNNIKSGKSCSICGKWYSIAEFHYYKRENNSYCHICRKEHAAAYTKGGKEETLKYRESKWATWKNK